MEIEFFVQLLLVGSLVIELVIRAFAAARESENRDRYLPTTFFARLIVFLVLIFTFTDLTNWINNMAVGATGEIFLAQKDMWVGLLIIYPAVLIPEVLKHHKRNCSVSKEI